MNQMHVLMYCIFTYCVSILYKVCVHICICVYCCLVYYSGQEIEFGYPITLPYAASNQDLCPPPKVTIILLLSLHCIFRNTLIIQCASPKTMFSLAHLKKYINMPFKALLICKFLLNPCCFLTTYLWESWAVWPIVPGFPDIVPIMSFSTYSCPCISCEPVSWSRDSITLRFDPFGRVVVGKAMVLTDAPIVPFNLRAPLQVGSWVLLSLPSKPLITSLLSGNTGCSRFVFYLSCPTSGTHHFSQKPSFF